MDRALSLVGQAGQYVQKSIEAAMRGGFTAMAVNLRGAQQQLRQVHGILDTARTDVGRTAAPVMSAPKEIDAAQAAALLAPLPEQIDKVRSGLLAAIAQIPPVGQRIAASANQNPAIGVLTEAVQQVLAPTVQRAVAMKETIAAAVADARAAQSGE